MCTCGRSWRSCTLLQLALHLRPAHRNPRQPPLCHSGCMCGCGGGCCSTPAFCLIPGPGTQGCTACSPPGLSSCVGITWLCSMRILLLPHGYCCGEHGVLVSSEDAVDIQQGSCDEGLLLLGWSCSGERCSNCSTHDSGVCPSTRTALNTDAQLQPAGNAGCIFECMAAVQKHKRGQGVIGSLFTSGTPAYADCVGVVNAGTSRQVAGWNRHIRSGRHPSNSCLKRYL